MTLWLPKAWLAPRVLLAVSGPALAFVLVLSHLGAHGIEGGLTHIEGGHHDEHVEHADEKHHDETADHGEKTDAEYDKAKDKSHDAPALTHEAPQGTAAISWIPSMNLNLAFLADGLGGFFALLVSGIGVLIVLYARGYFGNTEEAQRDLYRFYPTLGFFATAMMGVVLADYTLLTLVFWELTSISSFLLIGWDRYDKHAIKLAKQAFFTTGLGGMGLLGGIALFGYETGIWRWSDMIAQAGEIDFGSAGVLWSFVLMFIGAGSKSAQWPLHYWLPGAMAAPTPVSAYLHSATMVKAGVFLVGRLLPVFAPGVYAGQAADTGLDIWPYVITWFGAVTMLYGGITAVNQHDLKRIFAYTTVSQLGLLMAMYGLAGFSYHDLPTIDFDITQIANHAFYKAPLFITAGAIGHVASRSLPELFGAFHKHKAICLTMLLAGYALAAGPGTISFAAKELFLYAIVHAAKYEPWLWLILVMTIVTAACNVAIFVRLLTTLMGWKFGLQGDDGKEDDHAHHDHHPHEHGFWGALIWLPAVPLVALQYLGGIITPLWNAIFLPFEKYAFYEGFHGHVPSLLHALLHPGLPLMFSLLAIILGVGLGLSKLLRGQHTDINDSIYPAVESLCVRCGRSLFALLQNGNLRYYILLVLVTLSATFVLTVNHDRAMIDVVGTEAAKAFEFAPGVILGVLICASALLLPVLSQRVIRVLLLGSCGFTVVAMYIIYQAPDLALTQLMVEIISVLLFVLVLRLLPDDPEHKRRVGRSWRAAVAIVAGLIFGWMTLVAATGDPAQQLGEWFVQNSYHGEKLADGTYGRGGGGFNVVNVILVDFRGFDTLGEVTVLALAALGVWSMLPGRRKELENL
ncbi:multicomponent K+:H+ antiporter subunit A [Algisphaera agarilytica]|uniref:Multicomponent K+:H+ antiporter subunit A n=1 Tax=Algisphaera agarilytica TaxID=1385975 RepID=A0A7X0LJZ3_9BACT|nr:multicomponent K+:H+ antiporter subunit A [Algisphaera agarilytica]